MGFTLQEKTVQNYKEGKIVIGEHLERSKFAVLFIGVDSSSDFLTYGFSWLDSLLEEGLLEQTAPNTKNKCVYCDTTDTSHEGKYTMMYYPKEMSVLMDEKRYGTVTVKEMLYGNRSIDFNDRIWKVTTPHIKYEDITVRFMCMDCYADVLDHIEYMLEDISSEFIASFI